jgi:hypothetical protein
MWDFHVSLSSDQRALIENNGSVNTLQRTKETWFNTYNWLAGFSVFVFGYVVGHFVFLFSVSVPYNCLSLEVLMCTPFPVCVASPFDFARWWHDSGMRSTRSCDLLWTNLIVHEFEHGDSPWERIRLCRLYLQFYNSLIRSINDAWLEAKGGRIYASKVQSVALRTTASKAGARAEYVKHIYVVRRCRSNTL